MPVTPPPLDFSFSPNDQSVTHINGEPAPQTMPEPPHMSAYNEATETSRVPRLMSAWGAACAATRLLSNRYRQHWDGAVAAMHDHKGSLEVTWRDEQSRVMFEGVIVGAWEDHGEHSHGHLLAP